MVSCPPKGNQSKKSARTSDYLDCQGNSEKEAKGDERRARLPFYSFRQILIFLLGGL